MDSLNKALDLSLVQLYCMQKTIQKQQKSNLFLVQKTVTISANTENGQEQIKIKAFVEADKAS